MRERARTVLDNKELIATGKTDATAPLIVGGIVFDVLAFDPHNIIKFNRKQYQFLNAYRLGVSLEEAALKADMNPDTAERFLKRPDTVKWLEDRALMHHIKSEWEEPAKWYEMGDRVLEGKKKLDKAQTEVWKEFGKRVAPLRGDGPNGGTHIEINIDPDAIERARAKKRAIDGEIVR